MNRLRWKILSLLWLASGFALADPIHAIADGAYWHHDSGFVFVPAIGEFSLVGIPQDVAGSRDAVAYYARGAADKRTVVAITVYPADSDVGADLSTSRVEEPAPAGGALTIRYLIAKRDWRVRIEAAVPSPDPATLAAIDALVRGQRWTSLASN